MWTTNINIRTAANDTDGRVVTVVHNPDFEGFYLNESPKKDKPYNIFKHLTSNDFDTDPQYDSLRTSLEKILDGTHPGIYQTVEDIENMA